MNYLKLLITILPLISSHSFISQNENYMKLLVLLVDENYEKCLKKSLKYTENVKSKKDPLPYLYASMSYFKISREHKYKDQYPKAFKKSVSYLGKYRKKDPSFKYKEDAIDHIEKIKIILHEDIENNKLRYPEKSHKKNKSLYKKIEKLDPKDISVKILRGISEIKNKNKTEGKKIIAAHILELDSISLPENFNKLNESQQLFNKEAIIEYTELYFEKKPKTVKDLLNKANTNFIEPNKSLIIEDTDDIKLIYKQYYN